MFGSRFYKTVAVLLALVGVFATTNSAEAGLRHRCRTVVCRPLPCPVVVVQPVRVMAVPVAIAPQVRMAPVPALPCGVPGQGGPRVVVKKYKITKIRYKVPKRPAAIAQPQPWIPAPVVSPVICAPVICQPVICCPAPIICPPICIPKRCCPIRNCR